MVKSEGGNRRGLCKVGAYQASVPTARELFKGLSAGTDFGGSSASGDKFQNDAPPWPWQSDWKGHRESRRRYL